MQRERIKRRLDAIEKQYEPAPRPVLILIEDVDGTVKHDGIRYADIDTALDALKPDDHILVKTLDYSKPAAKAKDKR